ncbi:unnamed protein product [Chironomus riparius]|uniref:PHD finger protein 14 n=1 Tax=Chironomus riparius TaxID=315576 RepID=A0A9N9S259_9DIPT|nr:unnamed protein product [Chironomus riparius]
MKEKRTSALSCLLLNDILGTDEEESSDEDFRVSDHSENSDISNDESDADSNSNSDEKDESSGDELNDNIKESNLTNKHTTNVLLEQAKSSLAYTQKILMTPICCACLGDRSDDTNEIVECDGCKITVHEGCYGISDSISISSTVSSCSTEPWFCDPCKATIKDPDCELCPNKGGIFKETDCGKWVHLVCALYVPGVAFGEVDQLSSVTLFEMQYNKWGAKTCSLCEDDHFARTGVCIGCDAGMCKSYFHVTCAQREGLLSEAHHDEVDQADPFYAHCRVHSDKFLIKNRKKNFNALLVQMKRYENEVGIVRSDKTPEELERIERKLKKHRIKYAANKLNRPEPWVPTQKMPRSLITSASAVKKLRKKAEIMEIDTVALEFQEAQIASLKDIRKKWHISPSFTTEFVGYYLDRSIRLKEMKTNLEQQVELNKTLLNQQSILRVKYDDVIKVNQDVQHKQKDLLSEIEIIHNAILTICPNKQLQIVENIGKALPNMRINTISPALSSTPPPQMLTSRTMSVPTAAALKQGVGFPLNNLRKDDTGRILSTQCITNDDLLNECGICKKCNDQHLLAKCDTCHLYYHLGCLNPPLTRHPKKSKLYAWQCSECDNDNDSSPENKIIPKGPRRSRIRYSKDGLYHTDLHDSFGSDQSLLNISKSDESIQYKISNGADITLSEHEIEEHVKETLDVDRISTVVEATSSNIPNVVSTNSEEIVEKDEVTKREKKSNKSKSPSKSKISKKSASISSINSESALTPELPSIIATNTANNSIDNTVKDEINLDSSHETIQEPINLSQTSTASDEKKPKRGRPPKRTLSQISNDLQKLHEGQNSHEDEDEKPEMDNEQQGSDVTLIDMSKKIECPLDQYRAFADIPNSIPYPLPNELPKFADEPENIPITHLEPSNEPLYNGQTEPKLTNGDGLAEYSSNSVHHKHKKRKSHKRHHSHSPSSNDRQSSVKKHKKKHKHKDYETPGNDEARPSDDQMQLNNEQHPRIKIKFRAILQTAGDDKKPPKFLWHVPNEESDVAAENPNPTNPIVNQAQLSPVLGNGHHVNNQSTPESKKKKKGTPKSNKKARLLLSLSTSKSDSSIIQPSASSVIESPDNQIITNLNKSLPLPNQVSCDVCNAAGSSQNLVKCDDCQKNYHFQCLIPPLKKTPKKRGYSWHCADCDPTDHENN